ncbi:MAG: hypothetical protein ABIZ91_09740 [Gemmatimonadaceae bacterium]
MNSVNRMLVVMGALLLALASITVLAAGAGMLPPQRLPMGYWLQEGLRLLTEAGRAERLPGQLIAFGALLLALGVIWLEWRTAVRAERPILVSSAPTGDVTLSRTGVEHLAEHVASQVEGVLQAQATVHGGARLRLACRVCITPETHAPEIAATLRPLLKQAVERHVGRAVSRVSIHTQLDTIDWGRAAGRVQ